VKILKRQQLKNVCKRSAYRRTEKNGGCITERCTIQVKTLINDNDDDDDDDDD
jgi:hypothetical protein